MPISKLWQIRYRVNDEGTLQLYCDKLSEISGGKVIFGVNHFGTEGVFGKPKRTAGDVETDQSAMVSTHCHILFETPTACSPYICKKLVEGTGIYDTPVGSVLGSRDKSISIANDISGAMGYFLWEFVRSPPDRKSTLLFFQGRHYINPEYNIETEIRLRAYEHYQAKREHYNRRQKRSGNKRLEIYKSFIERYASGYNGTFQRLFVEYSKALFGADVRSSNYIIEQDVLNIYLLNNAERQDKFFKGRAQAAYEKYFPESW